MMGRRRIVVAVLLLSAAVALGLAGVYGYWWWRPAEPAFGVRSERLAAAFLEKEKAQGNGGLVFVRGEGDEPRWAVYGLAVKPGDGKHGIEATVGKGVLGNETVSKMAGGLRPRDGAPVAAVNGNYFELGSKYRYQGTTQGICIVEGEMVSLPVGWGGGRGFWVDGEGKARVGKVEGKFEVTWPDKSVSNFGLNCATSDFESKAHSAGVVVFTPSFGATTLAAEGGREYVVKPVKEGKLPLRDQQVIEAMVVAVSTKGNSAIPRDGMVVSVARGEKGAGEVKVGEVVSIGVTCEPSMKGVRAAVWAYPMLVEGGVVQAVGHGNRAPRTAVGMREDGTVVLVVVDGRQRNWSIGMTRLELAEWMKMIGCVDALNLDGGGSSTMWFEGKVVNSPSDGEERAVGNALVVVGKK